MNRSAFGLLFGLVVAGCGSSTEPASTTTAGTTTTGAGGAATTTTTTTGAGGATTTTGAGGAGGAGGGGCDAERVLQNDGVLAQEEVAFQSGFVKGECWAATFVDDEPACGRRLGAVHVLVGGADGAKKFEVAAWNVDADGKPTTSVGGTKVEIQAANDALSEVKLGSVDLDALDTSRFAIALCALEHDGLPSIARDTDGATAGRNWIFTNDAWVDAESLGVKGDWVERAVMVPAK